MSPISPCPTRSPRCQRIRLWKHTWEGLNEYHGCPAIAAPYSSCCLPRTSVARMWLFIGSMSVPEDETTSASVTPYSSPSSIT